MIEGIEKPIKKPYSQYRRKMQEVRRNLVARYYKQGYSMREIVRLVKEGLDLKTFSVTTCFTDIHALLQEWREQRLTDTDDAVQLELERIDDIVREAWIAWEKSKKDYQDIKRTRHGKPNGTGEGEGDIETTYISQTEQKSVNYGDTRFLTVIHNALIERRKLLGLYAPEKKEITGKDGKALALTLSDSELDEKVQTLVDRLNKLQ